MKQPTKNPTSRGWRAGVLLALTFAGSIISGTRVVQRITFILLSRRKSSFLSIRMASISALPRKRPVDFMRNACNWVAICAKFSATTTKMLDVNKCIAAYYLGEMRFSPAVEPLANNIKVNLENSHVLIDGLPVILRYPSRDALVKIGWPSVPAVVRNLADSDDLLVRKLSADVLAQVVEDKDIMVINIRKAMSVEKDPQNQARLQGALNAIGEIK